MDVNDERFSDGKRPLSPRGPPTALPAAGTDFSLGFGFADSLARRGVCPSRTPPAKEVELHFARSFNPSHASQRTALSFQQCLLFDAMDTRDIALIAEENLCRGSWALI
jgi:hypothetical protein